MWPLPKPSRASKLTHLSGSRGNENRDLLVDSLFLQRNAEQSFGILHIGTKSSKQLEWKK